MSIVIKGMEVPQNCAQCFLRVGGCKERIYMETRPKRCPIEPLATINTDTISRQAAIDDIKAMYEWHDVVTEDRLIEHMKRLPSAQPEIAENLYMYKCYITDKDGLQHEVIHTDDIRRVTGWEI